MFSLALLFACNADVSDTATETPEPPELAELSSGECPDFTAGTDTFLSSGTERLVTSILPTEGTEGAPVVFFFHGLMDSGYGYSGPGEYMANALDLQAVADEWGAVILLPDSEKLDLGIMEAYMWNIDAPEGADIALFDDLRTCAANDLGIDLKRVSAFGFSGGALFTTKVVSLRGDHLASAVEASGGAEAEIPIYSDPVPAYENPGESLPVLLVSGGDNDVWPNTSLVIVDFEETSDNLQDGLVGDGHFVVRCKHTKGHTLPNKAWNLAQEWLGYHTWGKTSPYEEQGLGGDDDWCTVAE